MTTELQDEKAQEMNENHQATIREMVALVCGNHGYRDADALADRMLADADRWRFSVCRGAVVVTERTRPLSLPEAVRLAAQADPARFMPQTAACSTDAERLAKIIDGVDRHERAARMGSR